MSYEGNKDDFEKALEAMKDELGNLDGVIKEDILQPFYNTINEYENHFVQDIEQLSYEKVELEDKIDTLNNDITELEEMLENEKEN